MIDAHIELNPKVYFSSTFRYSEILRKGGTKDSILPGDSPYPVPVGLQSVSGPPRVPRLLHGLVSLNSNLQLNFIHWTNFEIGFIYLGENFELRIEPEHNYSCSQRIT